MRSRETTMHRNEIAVKSKYLLYFCGLYIVSLLVTAVTFHRLVILGGIIEPGGIFVFPLMYFFGDVISEVYGYPIAKK